MGGGFLVVVVSPCLAVNHTRKQLNQCLFNAAASRWAGKFKLCVFDRIARMQSSGWRDGSELMR